MSIDIFHDSPRDLNGMGAFTYYFNLYDNATFKRTSSNLGNMLLSSPSDSQIAKRISVGTELQQSGRG